MTEERLGLPEEKIMAAKLLRDLMLVSETEMECFSH